MERLYRGWTVERDSRGNWILTDQYGAAVEMDGALSEAHLKLLIDNVMNLDELKGVEL